MEAEITKILIDKNKTSGGHCGTYIPDILIQMNVKYSEIRTALNKLYKEKTITIHEGSAGKLIFYKNPKTKLK